MEIGDVEIENFVRDTVFLTVSGVFTYIFVYLAMSGEVFKFKPGTLTITAGLVFGILGLVFASRMYMDEVACR